MSSKVTKGSKRSTLLKKAGEWFEGVEREEAEEGVTYTLKLSSDNRQVVGGQYHASIMRGCCKAENLMGFMNARASGRTSKVGSRVRS